MDIRAKLEEARKCVNQALIGLGGRDDVYEIRIPNLMPDEVEFVRDSINNFTAELLNKLQARRNQRRNMN